MKVDDKLVARLEELSSLTLSAAEKTRLKKDLKDILDDMARLSAAEAEGEPAESGAANVLRADEPKGSFAREAMLQNAPSHDGEMFLAPKTVE